MAKWRETAQLRIRGIGNGLLIAIAYATLCWAARKLSLDQFYLPAGVRLAALLLVPPRLWLYLLLGEYAYFAQIRIPLIDKYGIAWVVFGSATLMPTVAAITYAYRKRIHTGGESWILSACALSALAVTVLNVSSVHLLSEFALPNPAGTDILRFAVGDYVGMLTIVPLAMLWQKRATVVFLGDDGFFSSATVTIGLLLCLGVVAVAMPDRYEIATPLLQLTMSIPVVALTCLHGWKGAAITVPMLNLLVGLASTPWNQPSQAFDSTLFATQQILAIAGTAMLCMGSTISYHYHRHVAGSKRELLAAAHAKTSHLSTEMELKKRALTMTQAAEQTDHTLSEIGQLLTEKGDSKFAEDLMKVAVATSRTLRDQTSMV